VATSQELSILQTALCSIVIATIVLR
jgi:hypothetical protein